VIRGTAGGLFSQTNGVCLVTTVQDVPYRYLTISWTQIICASDVGKTKLRLRNTIKKREENSIKSRDSDHVGCEARSLDLTFMGPCIIISSNITNKMQRHTIFFITINAVHVSGGSGLVAASASVNSKQA
jgi:hypothetical protein